MMTMRISYQKSGCTTSVSAKCADTSRTSLVSCLAFAVMSLSAHGVAVNTQPELQDVVDDGDVFHSNPSLNTTDAFIKSLELDGGMLHGWTDRYYTNDYIPPD
eukprot:3206965-Pyramimonas_sp.AAC.1